jgi:predicted nucleic acid-binding protein
MKVTVDLNVLLDVAQSRLPHYVSSEEVLRRARAGEYLAVLPGHAVTTVHYVIEKWSSTAVANETIDGFLDDFDVHGVEKSDFVRARQLPLKDFEDAVVAAVAEASGSDYIITRNVEDFSGAVVPAISPADFLDELAIREVE